METNSPAEPRVYTVGEWTVHPARHEIGNATGSKRLQPRLIALLGCLATAPGSTVTREALLSAAWKRRGVSDEVLSRAIADLRQALEDDAREPRYIETIPKLGYRLIAAVGAPAAVETSTLAPPRRRLPRVAALIFIVVAGAGAVLLAMFWPRASGHALTAQRLLQAQPLTSAPGHELTPRFSRDGKLLAYAATDAGAGPSSVLMLRSRSGRNERQFTTTTDNDVCPLFIDRDQTLIWTRHSASGCKLLRQSLLESSSTELASCASVLSCPDLSADGDRVLFSAPPTQADHAAGIAELHLKDGQIKALTSPWRTSGDDVHPRFSPDGRISFVRGREDERSLWLLNGIEKRLPMPAAMVYGQSWLAPNQLLIASDALGFRALLKFDLANNELTLLGARGARFPDVARDGALIYEAANYDANLWRYRGDQAPEPLTRSLRYDAYPRLSPNGEQLAFQSNRNGLEAIWLLDLKTLKETELPLSRTTRWAHPAWSADGSTLLLTNYADAGKTLWRYRLGADQASPLPAFPVGAHDAQFEPSSTAIWFLLETAEAATLMRWTDEPEKPPEAIHQAVSNYQLSADALYWVAHATDQIQRCPRIDPKRCTTLPLRIAPGQHRNWALSAKALFYVSANNPGKISRYDLTESQSEVLAIDAPSTLSRAVDISSNEDQIILARTDELRVDLHWLNP